MDIFVSLQVRAHVFDTEARFTDKGKLCTYLMGSSELYNLINKIKGTDAGTQPPAVLGNSSLQTELSHFLQMPGLFHSCFLGIY